jgi:hypothetical protein
MLRSKGSTKGYIDHYNDIRLTAPSATSRRRTGSAGISRRFKPTGITSELPTIPELIGLVNTTAYTRSMSD